MSELTNEDLISLMALESAQKPITQEPAVDENGNVVPVTAEPEPVPVPTQTEGMPPQGEVPHQEKTSVGVTPSDADLDNYGNPNQPEPTTPNQTPTGQADLSQYGIDSADPNSIENKLRDLSNIASQFKETHDFINNDPLLREVVRIRKEGGDLTQLLPNMTNVDSMPPMEIMKQHYLNLGYSQDDIDGLVDSFESAPDYIQKKEILEAKNQLKQLNQHRLETMKTPENEKNKNLTKFNESLKSIPDEIKSLTGKNFFGMSLDADTIDGAIDIANKLDTYIRNPDGTANAKGIARIALALVNAPKFGKEIQKAKGEGQHKGATEVFNAIANPRPDSGNATPSAVKDKYQAMLDHMNL